VHVRDPEDAGYETSTEPGPMSSPAGGGEKEVARDKESKGEGCVALLDSRRLVLDFRNSI
jgi:hypothetical protein